MKMMALEHISFVGCLFLCFSSGVSTEQVCNKEWQLQIDASQVVLSANDEIEAFSLTFKKDEYAKVGDTYILCPCSIEFCMHRCTNYEKDDGTSLEAIKNAVRKFHHYDYVYPCKELNCLDREREDGYMTLHENESRNFFEFIYTLDEPYKIDHKQRHEYTVKANESFPVDKYADDSRYCYMVENGKIEIYYSIKNATLSKLIPACMLLSAMCLCLLLVAFVISRETMYIHGRCIACQAFSLMIGFAAKGFDSIVDFHHNNFMCFGVAYIGYYFFMSSFLWLNVICFDMFWTFCLTLKSTGTANLKRFKFYSLYAWLGSLVMTILLILASFVLDETHPLFSDIGREKCFADNGGLKPGTQIAFYHGPLLVLLIPNFIFFVITLMKIMSTQNMLNEALRMGSSNAERIRNKSNLIMNIKLFAIMGGSWIMESISWFFAEHIHGVFWIVFDVLNVLRGLWLLIFCVFLSKRVRTALWRKLLCVSVTKTTTASSRRNTATVSMSKCSQSDHNDQVEMRTLFTTNVNETSPRA